MLNVLQMSIVRRFALLAMMLSGFAGFAINDLTAASNKNVFSVLLDLRWRRSADCLSARMFTELLI